MDKYIEYIVTAVILCGIGGCIPDECTIMGMCYPSGKWMGVDVTGTPGDIVVLDDPEWSQPAWLFLEAYSRTTSFSLGNTGTVWAVYTTPVMPGTTFLRTSEEGEYFCCNRAFYLCHPVLDCGYWRVHGV